MFWTAVVWGLGVSLGVSLGMMSFVLMFAAFKRVTESETAKKIESFHERSHQALVERNELTVQMIAHLETIATAADAMADSQ
jgi:energy-converting hydrogenase Eha subunit H